MRCVRATTAAVEKQYLLQILSVCLQPLVSSMKCVCAILSSVACPVLLYFFPHFLINHDFRKIVIEHNCVFWFSPNLWNIHHSKKNWAKYNHKCIRVKCPLFLTDFNVSWIFWQIFEIHSNAKFSENPSSGSRVVACGRTDGQDGQTNGQHDKAGGRFSQFFGRAQK